MTERAQRLTLAATGLVTLVVAWTSVVAAGIVPQSSVPYPWQVAAQFPHLAVDGEFLASLADTVGSWLVALTLSSCAAIVAGVLIGTVSWLEKSATPAVNVFRSIPATALIPIAILFFGLGAQMKISVAVYATFWIVLINTVYGVASTEPMRRDAARSMQWSTLRTHAFVTLPSALPSIVTGIRVASGVALVVLVSAELLGAKSGLGTLMVQYQQALRLDIVYAMLVIIGLVGTALYSGLIRIEKSSLKWVSHA